jgi:hypothetical protein
MKAIFILTPVIILLGVIPTFAAAQQISNTILDQQKYRSCYGMGYISGQHNTGPNCPYFAPGTIATLPHQLESHWLGFSYGTTTSCDTN